MDLLDLDLLQAALYMLTTVSCRQHGDQEQVAEDTSQLDPC